MDITDYRQHDALALAALIRRREVTAAEVRAAALAIIDQENPRLNAVVEIFNPVAAGPADPAGPLAGVPFLLKDVGGVAAGLRNECGSRMGLGLVSPADSAVTARYRQAGLSLLGRSASPEMAFSISTESVAFGPTRNPWNPAMSAGGSSGGAAAAVASGMVPAAQANDGGGSIRVPAACCGVFGLKPTRGRLSEAPYAGTYLNGLSASHVVSRTVRDSAALLDATAGPAPGDPALLPPPSRSWLEEVTRPPDPLRIGWTTRSWNGGSVSIDSTTAVEQAASLLHGLGHRVEEAHPQPGIDWPDIILANARIWCANIARAIDGMATETGRRIDADHLEAATLACHVYGHNLPARDLLWALDIANSVSRAMGRFFTDFDILLTPMLPDAGLPLGPYSPNREGMDALAWTRHLFDASPFTPLFNMTGQPAMSVPWGLTARGVPVAVQAIGRFGAESALFRLAAQWERHHPWPLLAPSYPGVTPDQPHQR